MNMFDSISDIDLGAWITETRAVSASAGKAVATTLRTVKFTAVLAFALALPLYPTVESNLARHGAAHRASADTPRVSDQLMRKARALRAVTEPVARESGDDFQDPDYGL